MSLTVLKSPGVSPDSLSKQFELTEEERNELLPSGGNKILSNKIGWARFYLYKCGLLDTPRRAVYQITDEGKKALQQKPDRINLKFFEQYNGFSSLIATKKKIKLPLKIKRAKIAIILTLNSPQMKS